MARQHGVASTRQARALGVTRRAERRLLPRGCCPPPCPGVLTPAARPRRSTRRAMAAALAPGVDRRLPRRSRPAARARRLRGPRRRRRDRRPRRQPARPRPGVVVHRSRGDLAGHVVVVGAIPVLSVGATLALLAPAAGVQATARALDGADPRRRRPRRAARRRRGLASPGPRRSRRPADTARPPRRRRPNRGRSRFFGVSLPLSGSRKRQKPDAAGVTGAQSGGRRWSSNRCTDHGSPSLNSRRVRPRSSPSTANDTALSCESMSS